MTEAQRVTPPERDEYERTIRELADENDRLRAENVELRAALRDATGLDIKP